jgi:predicted aminopeptidase
MPVSFMRQVFVMIVVMALSGCADLGYYLHVANGQFDLVSKQRSIEQLLADEQSPADLKKQLKLVLKIRGFAFNQMHLPESGSYSQYADLGRPWVVKNLFAASEFSTTGISWCYPIAGCARYRGFFDEARLREFADDLEQQGHDVYITSVAAYSTLGWFDDPVLNTFVFSSETRLVGLIVHELAHQRLYVEDDSRFNESFASAVEQIGVERWLLSRNDTEMLRRYLMRKSNRHQVVELIRQARQQLAELYAMDLATEHMRRRKQQLIADLKQRYSDLSDGFEVKDGFGAWFERDINNAQLLSVSTYHDWVPAFLEIYRDAQEDLPRFYARVERLGELESEPRQRCLEQWLEGRPWHPDCTFAETEPSSLKE